MKGTNRGVTALFFGAIILMSTLSIATMPAAAAGNTYIVDQSGVCGSSADFPSIQTAIDNADPGDTIQVCSGVYKENVVVNKKGLTIEAINDSSDVGGPPVLDGEYQDGDAFSVEADDVRIDGFLITRYGSSTGTGNATVIRGASNVTVNGTAVDDTTGAAVVVTGTPTSSASDITVTEGIYTNITGDVAIEIGDADSVTVSNVLINDTTVSTGIGTIAGAQPSNVVVSDAVLTNISRGSSTGIDLDGVSSATLSTLALNETGGDGIVVGANTQTTDLDISDTKLENHSTALSVRRLSGGHIENVSVNDSTTGISLAAGGSGTIDSVNVTSVSINNSASTGLEFVADSGEILDSNVSDLAVNRTGTTPVSVDAKNTGKISNVSVARALLGANTGADGLKVQSDGGNVSELVVRGASLNADTQSASGLDVRAINDGEIQDSVFSGVLINQTDTAAVNVEGNQTATVRNVTVEQVLAGQNEYGVNVSATDSADISALTLRNASLNTDSNTVTGVLIEASDGASITDARFEEVEANRTTGSGIDVYGNGSDVALQNITIAESRFRNNGHGLTVTLGQDAVLSEFTVDTLSINQSTTAGISLTVPDTTTFNDSTVTTFQVNRTSGPAVDLRGTEDATVSNVTLDTARLGANNNGLNVSASGSALVEGLTVDRVSVNSSAASGSPSRLGPTGGSARSTSVTSRSITPLDRR
jgi:hypothetical protein